MKIGFFFNDSGFSGIDLSEPVKGNVGIGGTQYCFLMVVDALVRYSNLEITMYHYHENILPSGVIDVMITSTEELLRKAEADKVDCLVLKNVGTSDFAKQLRKAPCDCVIWAHNYLLADELAELETNPKIKRVVFVGREQYDRYIDHNIIGKSVYIYNMFDGRIFQKRDYPQQPSVTYTGSLVPSKGFHILARVWPDVLKSVPEAQLYVIGSGQVYDRNVKLGSAGIAEEAYEQVCLSALMKNGALLPSVHFMGTMGIEKTEIYRKTTVGVMNPSGKTETFGLSAVEMEACGIPVVTKAVNGLFDTVTDGENGYLVRNSSELKRRIVELLLSREQNERLGTNGKRDADTRFLPEKIVNDWIGLFQGIQNDDTVQYSPPHGHWRNNQKWLRKSIRGLRKKGIPLVPLVVVESNLMKVVKTIKKRGKQG